MDAMSVSIPPGSPPILHVGAITVQKFSFTDILDTGRIWTFDTNIIEIGQKVFVISPVLVPVRFFVIIINSLDTVDTFLIYIEPWNGYSSRRLSCYHWSVTDTIFPIGDQAIANVLDKNFLDSLPSP